jgi:hypothetical protein
MVRLLPLSIRTARLPAPSHRLVSVIAAQVKYERPNPELYNFEGALIVNQNEEEAIPLNLEQTLWRVRTHARRPASPSPCEDRDTHTPATSHYLP